MNKTTSKMGRPTSDPKTKTLKIRLSDSDYENLESLSKSTGKSKAEIIRDSINLIYKKQFKK